MAPSHSYGTITRASPGKHLCYQVRMDGGEELVIEHALIRPRPPKPLKKGCRLAVHRKDGKVDWASTDLSSPTKSLVERPEEPPTAGKRPAERPAQGPDARKSPAEHSPTGKSLSRSPGQPQGRKKAGKDTGKQGAGRPPTTATLARVVRIEPEIGQVTFQAGGKKIRIRLARGHPAWLSLALGRELLLETSEDEAGSPHTAIVLPATQPERKPPTWHDGRNGAGEPSALPPTQPEQKPPTWREEEREAGQSSTAGRAQPQPSPGLAPAPRHAVKEAPGVAGYQVQKIEGEQVGIPLAYFEQVQNEGHRFEIMAFLQEHLRDDLIEWYQMRPAQPARFAEPGAALAAPVARALHAVDAAFHRFYTHQARALDAMRAGQNLVIITQTASGKTLCYNPAIFEHFLTREPAAHALYLFPLNALLMDQKEKIDGLQRFLNAQGCEMRAEHLIGGVGYEKRQALAKDAPQILATNPEMLGTVLNEANKWQAFLASLRYVVIDEVHTYRGALGMHTAGLIRRLLLATRRLGCEPQFVLSSATVCNPLDLATRLTSLPAGSFVLLDERDDGSFQAHKHWAVLNPDAYDSSNGYDSYLNTAAMTMVELLSSKDATGRPSPLNTILFARSIGEVKRAYKIVQENLKAHPDLAAKVRQYVSSELGTNEKREIYQGLKSGQLVGIVSTNALEAGIDIGKLDACIMAGFPFWVMRMRQMAGRVGRHQEGLALYVPHPARPLDQYYRSAPELLLNQPPEAFVVDPENPYIARKHINAAAYRFDGISEDELSIFGSKAAETVDQAIREGVMRRHGKKVWGTRRDYKNTQDPYAITGIRSNAQRPYTLCLAGAGECQFSSDCLNANRKEGCARQVAVLDQLYAYRDCHPGAIYEALDGEMYQVVSFDDLRRVIWVERLPERTLERTFAEESSEIHILGEPRQSRQLPGGARLHLGNVTVTRSFTGYYTYTLKPVRRCRRCKRDYEEQAQEKFVRCPTCGRRTAKHFDTSKRTRHDFPEPYRERGFTIALKTVACWITIPAEMENALQSASPCKLPGDDNRVQRRLAGSFHIRDLAGNFPLPVGAEEALGSYAQAFARSAQEAAGPRRVLLFPGVYAHCLLHVLRGLFQESQALEIYAHLTQYPVTENLKHVCRKCQTSVLFPAMHTVEHTVAMRYPSVALGDPTDLGSYTTLGHPATGRPTIFWYDHYEGGLGAADKVYELFEALLHNSQRTLSGCACSTLEGCPNCTQIGHCHLNNDSLTRPGAMILIARLLGQRYELPLAPFIYPAGKQARFRKAYRENEYARQEHGIDEEAPAHGTSPGENGERPFDPYRVLRVQRLVHDPVLGKAYEVRSGEITNEIPAISAVELTRAYQEISAARRPAGWDIHPSQTPYQILEILPSASLGMVQQIYRTIAMQIHPDLCPGDRAKANERMKLVNRARDQILREKTHPSSED